VNGLRAAWLDSWKAPWDLGKGRRWGDPAWALAAISQAWLLGGREGRWPQASWKVSKGKGPWVEERSGVWSPRPDPAWVSLLRHGSTSLRAEQRGKREDELLAWCWQALLAGDGTPWMSLGSVILDRPARSRWIAVLGAVEESGKLQLPPFLEILIPSNLHSLPAGWWEYLLRGMDAEGRLLPEGAPPEDLPWTRLLAQGSAAFDPLVLPELPEGLQKLRNTPWLHELADGGVVLAPSLRAWARGFGACPKALQELLPPSLALGDSAETPLKEILQGHLPEGTGLSEAWMKALETDLCAGPEIQDVEACGEATLDRLQMRWGSAPAAPAPGYPAWNEQAHPCADPFHWMAEGLHSYRAQAMEGALRAFTWAHAHFLRLESPFWAERAAANAVQAALFWGDLPGLAQWRAVQGPQPSPFRELEELAVLAVQDEWERALPLARKLMTEHPHLEQPWYFLAQRGLDLGRRDWVEEALPHIVDKGSRLLFEAFLNDFLTTPPFNLDSEHALIWQFHVALRSSVEKQTFWQSWQICPNHPMRLELALALLEQLPLERSASRLLALQVLADRSGSPRHQKRLRALWPEPATPEAEEPTVLLKKALGKRGLPAWLIWGPPESPSSLGFGPSAPEGSLSHLHQCGTLAPFEAQGFLWWGFPLSWEGGVVGHALAAMDPDAPPEACTELQMLAPWLARLNSSTKAEPPPESGALLSDGSEPMASLLRELARVAPSELSLLILGPTGSGKELTAREIHRRSGRTGPLVPVNCSAFAESLLESELFGHVKGAFTGADRERRGAIESADKGTLFLDEVADLSPRLQSLFLRVLQEREVRRVGSERATHVDVRFVAATHRSLEDLANSGAFRRDLLYRLQGSVLELPSLRERRHEFPYLIPRILAQVARDARRDAPELAPGLAQALSRLPWPGNFRELRHALERALLRCGAGPLRSEHLPELQLPSVQDHSWEQATRDFQRRLLLDTLRQHHFQVSEAALSLGITRPALYTAAKRMGLDLTAERARWEEASNASASTKSQTRLGEA